MKRTIITPASLTTIVRIGRYVSLLALALVIGLGSGLPATAAPAPAENCTTMLKPNFDWAGPAPIAQGTYSQVYVTLTDHTAKDVGSYDLARDIVNYGSSNFYKVTANGQTMLQGTINLYTNQSDKGTWPFQSMGKANYFISIQPNGVVSMQPRIAGKNFLGRGPTVFQGTCSGGLLVATQSKIALFTSGSHALTLSFNNNSLTTIH